MVIYWQKQMLIMGSMEDAVSLYEQMIFAHNKWINEGKPLSEGGQ